MSKLKKGIKHAEEKRKQETLKQAQIEYYMQTEDFNFRLFRKQMYLPAMILVDYIWPKQYRTRLYTFKVKCYETYQEIKTLDRANDLPEYDYVCELFMKHTENMTMSTSEKYYMLRSLTIMAHALHSQWDGSFKKKTSKWLSYIFEHFYYFKEDCFTLDDVKSYLEEEKGCILD